MTDLVLERFWQYVKVDKKTGCWNWYSSINEDGYGKFWAEGKSVLAHRFAYQVNKCKIVKRLTLDHLCRNRRCVNPDHLEAVTHEENQKRSPLSLSSVNINKTHCPKGHELSGDNLSKCYLKKGIRSCRLCINENYRILYYKKRADSKT